jgi:hypothetical protein
LTTATAVDRIEEIRLAQRVKARSRDPEVLALCDIVLSTGQGERMSTGHKAVSTGQVVIASTGCPTCQRRRDVERDKKRTGDGRQAADHGGLGLQQSVKARHTDQQQCRKTGGRVDMGSLRTATMPGPL